MLIVGERKKKKKNKEKRKENFLYFAVCVECFDKTEK